MSTVRTVAVSIVFAVVLAGCGSEEPDAAPSPTGRTGTPEEVATPEGAAPGEDPTFAPGPQGDPDPSATYGTIALSPEEPSVLTYRFRNTTGTVTVPAEPDPQLERYRRGVGHTGPVVYAEVEIDNRQGFEPFPVQGVRLSTPGGGEALFVIPPLAVAQWSESSEPSPEMQELAQIIEAEYKEIGAGGAVETVPVVLSGELPTGVTSAALQLPAFDEIPLAPTE